MPVPDLAGQKGSLAASDDDRLVVVERFDQLDRRQTLIPAEETEIIDVAPAL
jgi:hypothetical protein